MIYHPDAERDDEMIFDETFRRYEVHLILPAMTIFPLLDFLQLVLHGGVMPVNVDDGETGALQVEI